MRGRKRKIDTRTEGVETRVLEGVNPWGLRKIIKIQITITVVAVMVWKKKGKKKVKVKINWKWM